jgi:hypothetical protein
MRPQVLGGIQERADAFIRICTEPEGRSIDAYVRLLIQVKLSAHNLQVYLHCFALDCATHHLFHPYGTHSIENKEDFKLVQELSYHNSLQRKHLYVHQISS